MRFWIAGALVACLVTVPGMAAGHRAEAATFKLVDVTCKSGQVQVGHGCWDQQAVDKDKWSVHDGNATWREDTFNATYTWKVPQELPPAGGDVDLAVRANDVTSNSGIEARVCVLQGFTQFEIKGGDACADALAPKPASSKSASKTATVLTANAPVDQDCPGGGFGCVSLMLSLGDGGNVYYTYRAQAAQRVTVHYTFRGSFISTKSLGIGQLTVQGQGSFEFDGPAGKKTVIGQNLTGSGAIQLHYGDDKETHSVELTPTRVQFNAPNLITVSFRVTKSNTRCLPVNRREKITLIHTDKGGDGTQFESFCNTKTSFYDKRVEVVTITSS